MTIANEKLIEYVRQSAGEVFASTLGMEIRPQPARVAQAAPEYSNGVLSLIGLAGPWVGAGTITCSAEFACRLCERLLDSVNTEVNQDVLDAVGEVTNMSNGNFKNCIEPHLGPMGLSIPAVIFDNNFQSRSSNHSDWNVVPFLCEQEPFEVRVCLSPAEPRQSVQGGREHAPVS